MSGRSPGMKGAPSPLPYKGGTGGTRCLLLLQRCLAIQLQKTALGGVKTTPEPPQQPSEYWMYDSGYLLFQACIIGAETKKLLYLGIRNKYCYVCSKHKNSSSVGNPPDHKCFKNYTGPSTGMETDIIVEGFNCSEEQHGLQYRYYIGDGDSSVYPRIKKSVSYGRSVIKIDCANHVVKCYTSKLHLLRKNMKFDSTVRKLLGGRLPKLSTAARSAIRQSGDHQDVKMLQDDLKNGPRHVFGDHSKCRVLSPDTELGSAPYGFCKRKVASEDNHVPMLEECGLMKEILGHLDYVVLKAHTLKYNMTNNEAERFNSLVAKLISGKRVDHTKRGGYRGRIFGAGLAHSSGPGWHLSPLKRLTGRSPGNHTKREFMRRKRKNTAACHRRLELGPTYKKKLSSGPDKEYGPLAAQEDLPEDLLKKKSNDFLGKQKAQVDCLEKQHELQEKTKGLLEANLKCFWNASLLEAMKMLQFQGYVSPGVLLVTASACVLEVVRAAWSRNVLKPPNNYVIAVVGDIDDCLVQPLPQGQFTPLPEALCWVILDLTSAGQPAVLDKIRTTLSSTFPSIESPSSEVVYDALAKLMVDRKVYQTSQGYFVVTPERRRRDSGGHNARRHSRGHVTEVTNGGVESRQVLMSPDEAMTLVHGEMTTIRDGDVTHQSVQTNLADVICGGNPNDKVVYARSPKRSSSFPAGRLERRHSLRFFGSSKRLSSSPSRSGSLRHINKQLPMSDSSSSTEYPSTDSNPSPKKSSLLSRLFRRSKRGSSVPPLSTFSAQFPPAEWFNQRVVHMHSVGTQTNASTANSMSGSLGRSQVSFATWTDDDGFPSRSSTLPRRHRRHDSAGSSIAHPPGGGDSTPRASRRHRSPSRSLCGTSRSSGLPTLEPRGSSFSPCKSSATTLSSSDRSKAEPSPPSSAHSGGYRTAPNGYHSSPGRDNLHRISPNISRATNGYHVSPNSGYVGNGLVDSTNSVNEHVGNGKSSPSRYSDSSLKQNLIPTNHSKMPYVSPSVNKTTGSPVRVTAIGSNSSPDRSGFSSRSSLRSSLGKGKNDNKILGSPRNSQLISPTNKSSITLQVSTTNRSSPTLTSGYSSQCPSTNGEPPSVNRESPSRSYTVTSESPILSTTTTTTIDGSNTKIFVQQQNSPVRSLITFENGTSLNKSRNGMEDILIINEPAMGADKENLIQNRMNEEIKRQRPKLERPTSLYSPREVMKSGYMAQTKNTCFENGRRCPSVESLTCSDITVTSSEIGRSSFSKQVNNNTRMDVLQNQPKNPQMSNANPSFPNHHPNCQPPSTPTFSEKNMNNTRKLSNSGLALNSPSIGKDGLSYKNVFGNPLDNPFGSKNNITSPDKTFDSTGSFNNLFIQNFDSENKLSSQNLHGFSSTKTLDDVKDGLSNSDLCTFPSLGDLSVNFKSIAAQKILKGISINSIDTLVEVNMAAAEKQNNCDVTVHTDFGVV